MVESHQIVAISTQALESLHLTRTTNNLETFRGRFEFLIDKLDWLDSHSHNPIFNDSVNEGIERYKELYQNRDAESYCNAVREPKELSDRMTDSHATYFTQVVSRYANIEAKKINELKRVSAKIKRIESLIEYLNMAKSDLAENFNGAEAIVDSLKENIVNLETGIKELKSED